MDAREELKRWIALVVQNAAKEDSSQVKSDIDLFLGVSGQLAGVLSSRNETFARKSRPNRSKPPTLAPAKPLQQPDSRKSSTDTPDPEMDAQDAQKRPEGKKAGLKSPRSEQQALRRQTYGRPTQEKKLQQAAKKLAS